jgi:hypothetical protein
MKERAIEHGQRGRKLASSLKKDSGQSLDFGTGAGSGESRFEVQSLLSDLVQSIALGDVKYITVGQSKDGGAVLVTVNAYDDTKSYAGGHNWEKLARELAAIFAPDAD